MKKNEEEY